MLPSRLHVWWSLFVTASYLVYAAVPALSAPAPRLPTTPAPVPGMPVPVTVDADTITYDADRQVVSAQGNVRITFRRYRLFADAAQYDLRTQVAVATGRVRFVDTEGRELLGRALTYNARTEEGVLEPVEGIVDRPRRVYVRGDRLEVTPQRYVAYDSLVTTCDPQRPTYSLTARRIEVLPDEAIVAHHATLYLRGRRLVTVPRYVVSLHPGVEGTVLPGLGFNALDGFWVDYRIPMQVGSGRGRIYVKYGTTTGIMPVLSFDWVQPASTVGLRFGRAQLADDRVAYAGLRYDVAEAAFATMPSRIASSSLWWSFSGTVGWYSELVSGVATPRLDGVLAVETEPIAIAPRALKVRRGAARYSGYGTGAVRTVLSVGGGLTYRLDPVTTVSLGYQSVTVQGSTPLSIDVVDPARTLTLGLERAVPDRYRLGASVAYNAAVPETKVTGSFVVAASPSLEVGVSAAYNLRTSAFDDVDYTLRVICDCVDAVVRYRQIRREISVEFGLVGITERRGLVPRRVPAVSPRQDDAPPEPGGAGS